MGVKSSKVTPLAQVTYDELIKYAEQFNGEHHQVTLTLRSAAA